jgi:PPOX class probable F420-dependent enzyme
MPAQLPAGLLQLLNEPAFCQLSTLMPDGSPQITQVWVGTDGEHILISTADCRQKLRNIRRDPRVAVNVVDPANAWRVATIRGRVVEITTDGADRFIDHLTCKYLGLKRYPFHSLEERRVTLKIAPERISQIGLEEE